MRLWAAFKKQNKLYLRKCWVLSQTDAILASCLGCILLKNDQLKIYSLLGGVSNLDISQFLQYIFSGLTMGSVYALIAISLVMVYKVSKIIMFAQGEFFVLGALIMISLSSLNFIPMPIAFVLSIALVSLVGISIERVLIQPLLGSSIGKLVTLTIAVSLALRGLLMIIWGRESQVLPPFSAEKSVNIYGAVLSFQVIWIVVVTAIVLLAIWFFFEKTFTGLAIRATSENRIGASLVGISVPKVSMIAWALGASLGALAGILIAPLIYIGYASGIMPMFKGFTAMAIGGLNSNSGAVVAGLIVGILESFTIGFISSQFSNAIVFALLIAVLVFKPGGLFGNVEESGGM